MQGAVTLIAAACSIAAIAGGCSSPHAARGPGVQRSTQAPGVAGMSISETILVPETPIQTNQNYVLRTSNASGRNYAIVLGPGPGDDNAASGVMHNSESTFQLDAGMAVITGIRPIMLTTRLVTGSWGTAWAVWSRPEGDYVVGLEVKPQSPVNVSFRANEGVKGVVMQDTFILVGPNATTIPQCAPVPQDPAHPARRLYIAAKNRLAAAALAEGPDESTAPVGGAPNGVPH